MCLFDTFPSLDWCFLPMEHIHSIPVLSFQWSDGLIFSELEAHFLLVRAMGSILSEHGAQISSELEALVEMG